MRRCIAITGPRDSEGRAPFTMFWLDIQGPWRTEPSTIEGAPVGYRRAQCFRAVPESYLTPGTALVETEADGMAQAYGKHTRVFDAARKAQGFRSQRHLDAFYRYYDHTQECSACHARDGYVLLDDGYQPTSGRCDEAQRLDAQVRES